MTKPLIIITIVILFFSGITLAAAQSGNPPDDPLAHGEWLYGGYCTGCHGSYKLDIAGRDLKAGELRDAISGDVRGCRVKWSILHGGPLTGKQINALTAFITAWQEKGGPPDLPPLPVFPTFTPEPSATSDHFKPTEIPSPTPLVETDPQILAIINANPVAMGARLFTRRCYRCHLSYQYGRMAIGMDEEKLKETITKGKVGSSMRAFGWREGGNLITKEINALAAYILAWEKLGSEPALPEPLFIPPTPDPHALQMKPLLQVPLVEGRVQKGLALYGEHCQSCHGVGGYGALAPCLRKDWNSVRADLTIRAVILNGVPGAAMPAWGERLNADQINNLVALILEWSQDPPLKSASPRQEIDPIVWLPVILVILILPISWFWRHKA